MKNRTYYEQRIQSNQLEYNKAKRRYQLIGTLRLIAFVCGFLSGYFFWGNVGVIIPIIFFLVLFLFLVHLSVNAKYVRDKFKLLIEFNQNELHVLEGNWSMFDDGSEYKNPQHPFAFDMDIFGKKSFFQLINRTVSKKGSDLLASQLMDGSEFVELTNEAILDLSKQPDWCQEFLVEGMVFKSENLEKEFQNIKANKVVEDFYSKILRLLIPISSVTATVLFSFDVISSSVFGVYIILVFGLIGRNLKLANSISTKVTSFSNQVKMFQRQLLLFSQVTIHSEQFKKTRDALFSNQINLLDSLNQLEKIQGRMDVRMNLIVGTVLNFFLAWDYQVLYQWEKWRIENESQLGSWENQLAQLEVWISGAIYKVNFPETIFAEFNENQEMKIVGLGHPFVLKDKRVLNDVSLNKNENFMIITGPNMAGKSTYLRSLGLANICANAGFPILAESCEMVKLKLYSSMRTSDDLTVESSYFHAELTRLRFIMDAIERGEKVFIILDEILKGTNSKDKEIGSAKFLQKLQRLNAKGVIATHDLSLCNLSSDNLAFKNMFFDSTITGDVLSFDYKIRPGICQNMNASFLLKQMKLVD
ncbi:MAG: hypothetical protein RI883_1403 [Bacteroidota bacterium]